jgi:hypothetical protein
MILNKIIRLNVPIKDVKCLTAQNASQFANNPIASLIVKLPNQNVKLFAKNPNAIGNVTNLNALNQNVNLYAKILIAHQKLNVALVMQEVLELFQISPSSKKLKQTKDVVDVMVVKDTEVELLLKSLV